MVLSALAGLSILSGCTPPAVPLRVGTIVFPGYEFLFLARAMGWLQPELVRLIELQNSSDSVRALAAGKLEAALLTLDEVMSARADGVDLRVIAVLDTSEGADQVLAKPGITLSNLAGRRIAAENSSVGALMVAALLEAAGIGVDAVVKVPTTQSRALEFYQKDLADVVVTAEPWVGQIKALGGRTIFDSAAVPDRIVDVIAVRGDMLDTRTQALQHLVSMQFQALELFRLNPQQASVHLALRLQTAPADVAASFTGLKLPGRKENQAMLRPGGTVSKNLPLLQATLLQAKLLRKPIDTNAILDDRFVQAGAGA